MSRQCFWSVYCYHWLRTQITLTVSSVRPFCKQDKKGIILCLLLSAHILFLHLKRNLSFSLWVIRVSFRIVPNLKKYLQSLCNSLPHRWLYKYNPLISKFLKNNRRWTVRVVFLIYASFLSKDLGTKCKTGQQFYS